MGRGNAAYALHDLATAEASFRQATVDHPDVAAAFNNLAQVLAERANLDEALPAAERAVSLRGPLLVTTQATLAEIRGKTGSGQWQRANARGAIARCQHSVNGCFLTRFGGSGGGRGTCGRLVQRALALARAI